MRSLPRFSTTRLPRAASRQDPAAVSPAALRIAQEADATMSPDRWAAQYAAPQRLPKTPPAGPASSSPEALPTA